MTYLLSLFVFTTAALGVEITPTKKLNQSVDFRDDLAMDKIELAIERQLRFYDRPSALKGKIRFGSDTFNKSILRESLEELQKLTEEFKACALASSEEACQSELNRRLNESFSIYVPNPTPKTRFTAYYSPDLRGARTPSENFQTPIYSQPPGNLARSYTRVQIDHDGKLAGKNLELFWVENSLFDIYLLHVQGGGRITLLNPDGSTEIRYLSMTGANGKKCEFIGQQIYRKGWLPRSEALQVSVQRNFLEENPGKTREAFRYCKNYIYFRESLDEPVGRNNIPLTEGRSIAVDHKLYPTTGLVTFARVRTPTGKNISRFFLAQDTGSKIRGAARSDLYMGYGPEAERTAYSLHQDGEQFFLIKK